MPTPAEILARYLSQQLVNRIRNNKSSQTNLIEQEFIPDIRTNEYIDYNQKKIILDAITNADLNDPKQVALVKEALEIIKPMELPLVTEWGKDFRSKKMYYLALLCFESILEYHKQRLFLDSWIPDVCEIYDLYCQQLIKLNRYKNAERALEEALSFQPRNKSYKKNLEKLRKKIVKETRKNSK